MINVLKEFGFDETGITKEDFLNYPLKNGFDCGDMIILFGIEPDKIDKGTIIVFFDKTGRPIIHRVVKIKDKNGIMFQTKGDHNFDSGEIDMNIGQENIVGRASFSIPFLGYVKIGGVELFEAMGIIDEQATCLNV